MKAERKMSLMDVVGEKLAHDIAEVMGDVISATILVTCAAHTRIREKNDVNEKLKEDFDEFLGLNGNLILDEPEEMLKRLVIWTRDKTEIELGVRK